MPKKKNENFAKRPHLLTQQGYNDDVQGIQM